MVHVICFFLCFSSVAVVSYPTGRADVRPGPVLTRIT
jgi:hypothetical protein